MKNIYITLIALLLTLPFATHATVGGATYVHTFTYNPKDESVYFIETSQNGRGCPPELKKISLNTTKTETVFSCEQGEKLAKYEDAIVEIKKLTNGFKPLTQIELSKNRIVTDVDFIRDINAEPVVKEFKARVYQDLKQVAEITTTGCKLTQPFTFAGYAIPGFNAKIIMLISRTEDCFEGGYIDETPFVVGGLTNLDKASSFTGNKTEGELGSNAATIRTFVSDTKVEPVATTTPVVESATTVSTTTTIVENTVPFSRIAWLLIGVIALGILAFIGGKLSK